ncbi:unnamed protein product [Symbiodinium pilosum]|uniref:Uncharacterized protein n=1 Tax=Symbiodinium pilosum TaxID=2952 RepID=A0A812L3X0_SYMPI|nr:unnamed protein product [Symbiodinium pilosum]
MVQCVGAVVVFFAARLCHAAFVTSIDVWYASPANRVKYYKAFREKYQRTGKADYSTLMKVHPETISETFGDESTSEGQMVKALVLPSTVVMAIGGIMMRCGGSDMWVVSGASGGNVAIREGKAVSNIELLYQMNWVALHMLGFFCFLGPAVFIELPIAIMELAQGDGIQQSWEGEACIQNARMVLAAMRVLCAVLLLFAAPFLAKTKTRNPNTLSALKWRAEFTVGEFGATQMYFNALSVWLQPGVGPYSWVDVVFLSLFALEAFRIFFVHALWTLILMSRWNSIDWKSEIRHRVAAHGPVMRGLREATGNELTFTHAVQAGVPDYSEVVVSAATYLPASLVASGNKYPRLKLLLLKPQSYANFRAMDFQELSDEDLSTWHMDLSRILSVLPSSDTLFFPSGAYKMNMNEPKVLLSMDEYESDLEHIGVSPNHMPAVDSQDDIALDVSAMVLSDLRAAFLSNTSFAESIRQGMPMAVSLYKLFGDIGLQIQAAIDAQQKGLQHFDSDEEAAWSEAESDEDEPLVRTDLPMAFEIQIRGFTCSRKAATAFELAVPASHGANVQRISAEVVPNQAAVPGGEDHVGMDITEKVLADPRGAFLAGQSLESALQEPDKAVGLYALMSEMCQETAEANPQKTETQVLEGSAKLPLLVDIPTLGFEFQIRGIKKPKPTIVMRIPKEQAIPKAWGTLPKATAMPDSTK